MGAVNGAWMGKDNLPSRSCVVVRCGSLSEVRCVERVKCSTYKSRSCADGRSLYNAAADLHAVSAFESLELEGHGFLPGDVVLPMVGTNNGMIVPSGDIDVNGGHMFVRLHGAPLLNAMLFAIPDEPKRMSTSAPLEVVMLK